MKRKETKMKNGDTGVLIPGSSLDATALAMLAFGASVAQAIDQKVLTDEQATEINNRGIDNFKALLAGKGIPGYMEYQPKEGDGIVSLEPTTNEVLI